MKSLKTIQRTKRELRKIIDTSPCPYEQRIAHIMGELLTWVSQDVDWKRPATWVKAEANILQIRTFILPTDLALLNAIKAMIKEETKYKGQRVNHA